METKSYDYAFPVSADILEKQHLGHFNNCGEASPFGLTKREHFASLAMQSYLINSSIRRVGFMDRVRILFGYKPKKYNIDINAKNVAEVSVDMADRLITELNK